MPPHIVAQPQDSIGVIGTSYQFMASVTYVVAGASVHWLGWRGAFYVPAALLAVAAVHMLLFLREAPGDAAKGAASAQRGTRERDVELDLERRRRQHHAPNLRCVVVRPGCHQNRTETLANYGQVFNPDVVR